MIIVTQNKNSIYNFENVKSINVIKNEIYITDDILADAGARIAKYKTEERAKEVMEEIINRYEHSESLVSNKSLQCENILTYNYTYQMPEE